MTKINKFLAFGVLLLAVAIPLTTWLAVNNQENRSKAASDETGTSEETSVAIDSEAVDGVCGEMNGQPVKAIPDNRNACTKGAVNWMDSKATDGAYNWDCIGKMDGVIAHCEASLEK